MTTYTRKAQVLLTEEEYKTLEDVSARTRKKLGTLIREAVEIVYVAERKRARIAGSIDRLLSLPPAPAPADYQRWEEEYGRRKQPCGTKK